ncbi:MAG: hypothetical protein CBARDCOR_0499 [uncultured Caballeronia sp.]|nr:MAG: hypothetical protein CBARDCOR_0499 [uncultured Caballeronia sp.]
MDGFPARLRHDQRDGDVDTPTLLHCNGLEPAATAIVLAFFNLGAFIDMASAGRLVDRFGAPRMLFPVFIGAALLIAALGSAGTLPLAIVIGTLLGLTISVGGAGAIAVASLIYPPAIR